MFMQKICYSQKWNTAWSNTKLIRDSRGCAEPRLARLARLANSQRLRRTHSDGHPLHHLQPPTPSHTVHTGTLCMEMAFPIPGIVRARLLQLHGHIKKDRKWNVDSKCNTFLIYVLHLLRQLPGCSWKKNDLFIYQVHYFSSLEEDKNVFILFSSPHVIQHNIFYTSLKAHTFIRSLTANSWAPTMCWLHREYWG